MADRVPGAPQVDDPTVVADFIRSLGIRGRLGELSVSDIVVPVFNIGQAPTITVSDPIPIIGVAGGVAVPVTGDFAGVTWRSGDIFTNGVVVAPAANAIMADTGQLPAGDYDIGLMGVGKSDGTASLNLQVQHRNAANNADQVTWDHLYSSTNNGTVNFPYYSFVYTLALNERIRVLNIVINGQQAAFTIFARIRP